MTCTTTACDNRTTHNDPDYCRTCLNRRGEAAEWDITTPAPDPVTMEAVMTIERRTEILLMTRGHRPSRLLDAAMAADGALTVRLLPPGCVVA